MPDKIIEAIIRNFKQSLEELELDGSATFTKLLELRSMPKLKVFNCYGASSNFRLKEDEVKTLTNNLPYLIRPINEKEIEIVEFFSSQNQGLVWFDFK